MGMKLEVTTVTEEEGYGVGEGRRQKTEDGGERGKAGERERRRKGEEKGNLENELKLASELVA